MKYVAQTVENRHIKLVTLRYDQKDQEMLAKSLTWVQNCILSGMQKH